MILNLPWWFVVWQGAGAAGTALLVFARVWKWYWKPWRT